MGLFTADPLAPYKEEIDALAAEFQILREGDSKRLRRYDEYRAECEATREIDLDLDIGSTDYGRSHSATPNERHRFKFPLGQALTVKHADRISGRLPDVKVDRRAETAEERHRSSTMEKLWWAMTRESDGDVQFSDAAWDASQVGAAPFEVYFDPTKQMPLYRAFDPATCLVVRGFSDPHEFQRVFRFWCAPVTTVRNTYRGRTFRGTPIPVERIQAGVNGQVTIVQVSDSQKTIRLALGDGKGASHVPLDEKIHNYGFVPYVVIPNLGPYRKLWGWADYEFIREIARYIAVNFGREADILRQVANGAMTARGTKLTTHQIKRALQEGGVVPVSKDGGGIDPIGVPEVPAFAQGHSDKAMDLFERLGFAPPAAWGASGATSGSDRGLQLQPLFELTRMKQRNWSAGLRRLAEYSFRILEDKQASTTTFRGAVPYGNTSQRFSMQLGPDVEPLKIIENADSDDEQEIVLPRNPKELFQGDYEINFLWQNREDPDDPAFVNGELQKFAQGVQSLETTLARLGTEAPLDEIRRIVNEAEKYPWIRDGALKMIEMQLNASQQGQGGGNPGDPAAALASGGEMMQSKDGAAMNADGSASGLNGPGTLFGAA